MHRDDPRGPSPLRYLLAGLALAVLPAVALGATLALGHATTGRITLAVVSVLAIGAGAGLILGLRARRDWRTR